jgi:hypothetical protein
VTKLITLGRAAAVVAQGSFTMKRLDYNIGQGLWAATDRVANVSMSESAWCCLRQNESRDNRGWRVFAGGGGVGCPCILKNPQEKTS